MTLLEDLKKEMPKLIIYNDIQDNKEFLDIIYNDCWITLCIDNNLIKMMYIDKDNSVIKIPDLSNNQEVIEKIKEITK